MSKTYGMGKADTHELVDEAINSFARADIGALRDRIDDALIDQLGDDDRGRVLLARSIVGARRGRPAAETQPELIEATGLLELSGELVLVAIATTKLAAGYLELDDVEECIDHAVRAIIMFEELEDAGLGVPPVALAQLATVFRKLTAFEMALNYAQTALDTYQGPTDDGMGLLYVLVLAECAIESAWHCTDDDDVRLGKLLVLARGAADGIDEAGSRHARSASLWINAELALLEADFERASEAVRRLQVTDLMTNDALYPHIALMVGVIAYRNGHMAEAIGHLDAIEESFATDPTRLHRLLRTRADAHSALGNHQLSVRDAYALADNIERRQLRYVAGFMNQVDSRAVAEQSRFELTEQANALTQSARQDELTGVGSRSWFDTCLAHRTVGVGNIALVLLDIDNFKVVNDTYSHVVGDDVLRRVGSVLASSCRDDDVVTRYGGEEFAIIPAVGELVGAHKLGERLRKQIRAVDWDEIAEGLQVSISVGVSVGPAKASAEVFRAADDALYEAKAAGRDCVIGRRLGRSNRQWANSSNAESISAN